MFVLAGRVTVTDDHDAISRLTEQYLSRYVLDQMGYEAADIARAVSGDQFWRAPTEPVRNMFSVQID